MGFKFDYFVSIFSISLPYLKQTMEIALAGFVLAMIVAVVIAVITEYKVKILYPICRVYVSFFRCTPIMSQLFFFYYGLAQISLFFRSVPAFIAIIVILGLNQASFMSETSRGAFSSIPKQQREACLACGMTNLQAMRRLILPQAIRVAIPGLSNSFIGFFKSTSLGFTIGVVELMSRAKIEAARTLRYMEAYLAVLIIYWIIVALFVYLQKKLETRMNRMY